MRTLYTLLWCCALPLLPLRLWWRGRREPGYRARIGERFGRYAADVPHPRGEVIWIHAVSLGETRAAEPLVRRIARARPQATILLTSMTATGREAGRALDGGQRDPGVAPLRRAVRGRTRSSTASRPARAC